MKRMYYNDKMRIAYEEGGETWHNVHPKAACAGRTCVIHNPSDHSMVTWPRHLRETGLVERICEHGVGHPDPDSARWMNENAWEGSRGTWGMHGCDGCCLEELPAEDVVHGCRPPSPPNSHRWLSVWECPDCGDKYIRARKKRLLRPFLRLDRGGGWCAPNGHWIPLNRP